MQLIEKTGVEVAAIPKDINGVATNGIWISLKNFNHLSIILAQGAWAGGTPAVTLQQATDIAGTGAKALGMANYWSKAGITASQWAKTAVVANTFNLTTTANTITAIEIDTEELDVTNGFGFVRVQVASPGANADLLAVLYALSEPRFNGAATTMPDAKV